ncbi:protein of unknown function [Pararobbsia alpina]
MPESLLVASLQASARDSLVGYRYDKAGAESRSVHEVARSQYFQGLRWLVVRRLDGCICRVFFT